MTVLFITGGILLLVIIWFIATYNGFIRLNNMTDEAWSGIDVQLKRRYDLLPNLVESVQGYARHEKSTFEKVVQARNQAMEASSVGQKAEAENILSGALKSLFALAESYPDLKASQNFIDLQKNLAEIEDTIQLARRYYNANVRDLNVQCQSFPSVMIAGIFNFKTREFFEAATSEREGPKIKFD